MRLGMPLFETAGADGRTAIAAALAVGLAILFVEPISRAAAARAPKPLEPARVIKLPRAQYTSGGGEDGYFDETFALHPDGARLAVIRCDGATFAKLETFDLATGKVIASHELPEAARAVERLEPSPAGDGVVAIVRENAPENPPENLRSAERQGADATAGGGARMAWLLDGQGRVAAKAGPATMFGRPRSRVAQAPPENQRGGLLIAFDRKTTGRGEAAETTYTITPYRLDTLAPAGKARSYRVDASGRTAGAGPALRIISFFDGYARAVAEKAATAQAPARAAILDTLTGKVTEGADIADPLAWATAADLRAQHPDRGRYATLNQDDTGVDVVDPMGNRQPARLAVPFQLYDGRSLRDQEGPEDGSFYFGITVDPVNREALRRRKADLPMLDIYATEPGKSAVKLRGRVFVPRPVTWRAGYGKLVVLKRFKSFARGGDELQVYDLR